MSYSCNQKRKIRRQLERNRAKRTVPRPKVEPTHNPSKVIAEMARAEGAHTGKKVRYWDYIKQNYKKFGGPQAIRIPMALVVEEIDREKAEKRRARRAAQ